MNKNKGLNNQKQSLINGIKPIIGILLFSLVLIGGAYFVISSGSKQPQVTSYVSQDNDKPIAQAKETFFDMGIMKVTDIKEKDFIIKNIGTKPLQLFNVASSCGCTTAQINYQNTLSSEFSMHGQSDYVVSIIPQTEAKIKVVYRPYVMLVYGNIEREVYISTNDPSNSKLVFKIKVFIQ